MTLGYQANDALAKIAKAHEKQATAAEKQAMAATKNAATFEKLVSVLVKRLDPKP